jgi:hypothetical protein
MTTEAKFKKIVFSSIIVSCVAIAGLFYATQTIFSPFEQVLVRGANNNSADYVNQKLVFVLHPEKKLDSQKLQQSLQISPKTEFTTTLENGALEVSFAKSLQSNTRYTLSFLNSGAGVTFDRFSYEFTTKPIQALLLKNTNLQSAQILLQPVNSTTATTIIEQPFLQSFTANEEYIAYSYGDLRSLPLQLKLGVVRIKDKAKLAVDLTLDLSNIFSLSQDSNKLLVKYLDSEVRKIGIINLDFQTKPEEVKGLENYKDAFELRLLQGGNYVLFNDITNNFYLRLTSAQSGEKLIGNYAKIAGEDSLNSIFYAAQFGNSKELIKIDLKGESTKLTTNFDTNFNFLSSPDLTTFIVSDIAKSSDNSFIPQVTLQLGLEGERVVIAQGKDNSYNDFRFSPDGTIVGLSQSSVFFSKDSNGNNRFEKKVLLFDTTTRKPVFELPQTDEVILI